MEEKIEQILESMTLHEKICQMFIVTPEVLTGKGQVTQAGETTEQSLKDYPVGGLIYMEYNLETKKQTKKMIENTQQYAVKNNGIGLLISVDEEGGRVSRCAESLGTTAFEPMYTYREQGAETAYDNAGQIAKSIKALGFNLDYAPVADTWSNPENQIIGTRAYSDDFKETATLVSSAVKGFGDNGVFCTLKHFPGHGDTQSDSHLGSVYSDKTIAELEKQEYLAFQAGIEAGADMVMIGHITMTAIDDLPATLSHTMITDELRGRLGFEGIVITDAMNMGAIAQEYTIEEGTIQAVLAGNDIILMPIDLQTAVKGLEDAVADGTVTEERINESVRRILRLKEKGNMIYK